MFYSILHWSSFTVTSSSKTPFFVQHGYLAFSEFSSGVDVSRFTARNMQPLLQRRGGFENSCGIPAFALMHYSGFSESIASDPLMAPALIFVGFHHWMREEWCIILGEQIGISTPRRSGCVTDDFVILPVSPTWTFFIVFSWNVPSVGETVVSRTVKVAFRIICWPLCFSDIGKWVHILHHMSGVQFSPLPSHLGGFNWTPASWYLPSLRVKEIDSRREKNVSHLSLAERLCKNLASLPKGFANSPSWKALRPQMDRCASSLNGEEGGMVKLHSSSPFFVNLVAFVHTEGISSNWCYQIVSGQKKFRFLLL